jgi:DNA-binding NarL/FixJ family response regulator
LADTAGPRVLILADDLIWSTRLVAQVREAGGQPVPVQTLDAFRAALEEVSAVIVDLTALRYDGVEAVAAAAAAGRRILAVGQHDDLELRQRAMAAGAERVFAYRKLFESGPATLGPWLTLATAESR